MDSERWQRIAHLYEAVAERNPDERRACLAAMAGGDEELQSEVESLFAHENAPLLIDRPLLEAASGVLDTDSNLTSGSQLGPYQIDRLLGAGGMGRVYRAVDTRLNRTVALKVLSKRLANDPQFRARFEREGRAVAGLVHPHI